VLPLYLVLNEERKMNIQISNNFSMYFSEPNELIELIDEEDKIQFLQSLSCHESVFVHVTDQIIHGCTEDGYFSSTGEVQSTPNTDLQNAVRRIAKNASEIADKQIVELERKLKELEKSNAEWQDKYYGIYHNGIK
jgi:hypothetical protein